MSKIRVSVPGMIAILIATPVHAAEVAGTRQPSAVAKAGPVAAMAKPSTVSRRIGYGDLDLASASGQADLNRRVGSAVEALCQEASTGEGSYWSNAPTIRCRASAWGQATPQIDRAVHLARDIARTAGSPPASAGITIVLAR